MVSRFVFHVIRSPKGIMAYCLTLQYVVFVLCIFFICIEYPDDCYICPIVQLRNKGTPREMLHPEMQHALLSMYCVTNLNSMHLADTF